MINCLNIHEYLSRYLDKELDENLTALITEHLSECPSCRSYFESESGLEKKLIGILGQPGQTDAAMWTKAVSSLTFISGVQRGFAPDIIRSRRLIYFIPLTSAALIMIAVGIFFLFWPAASSLDLLQASEQVHQSVLRPDFRVDFKTDSHDALTGYFKGQCGIETPGCNGCSARGKNCRIRGGRVCLLKRRQVPHIILDYNSTPISVLVLSDDDLNAFPEAALHLSRCFEIYTTRLREFNYALVRIGPNIVCAVSKVNQEVLSQLLIDMGATVRNCNECPKQSTHSEGR
jgi:hypothetical protein